MNQTQASNGQPHHALPHALPHAPLANFDRLTVRLVGAGGTGGIVGRYASVCLGSLNCETRLILIDGDEFEPQNATRMLFDSCGNKAEVVWSDLIEYFRDSRLTLDAVNEPIQPDNIKRLLPGGKDEVILLCVDNHATRKLVSDYCEGRAHGPGLNDICLISGGNDGIGVDSSGQYRRGSYGNCQIYVRQDGRDVTPSLTRFHREIDHPADKRPDEENCTEAIRSTPQHVFTNLMTASAICNTLWLYLSGGLHYSELGFDTFDGSMRPLGVPGPDPIWRSP